MIIEIILFSAAGILAGIITGLIPGLHINLIGALLVSATSTFFLKINPLYLAVFIVAMAIAHTFIDFIPSVFLGCPDTDTELSILPGHEMLKSGRGYEAVMLTAYGSLAAIFILVLIFLPSVFLLEKLYLAIKKLIPYFLMIISIFLIYIEKDRLSAALVFSLTGFLGVSVLNFPENILNQPLLPLLTGLFGSSALIISMKSKVKIPLQLITKPSTKVLRPMLGAAIASPLCSFLPGLGSGQAAIIGHIVSRKRKEDNAESNNKHFLVLLGATNTLVMGFSFITLYLISKTRTGAAAAIKEIIGIPSMKITILILFVIVISGIVSFFITDFLTKIISREINKIDYFRISLATILVLVFVVFAVSGVVGVIVLIVSTLTGIYCISLKVRRTNMMGCLLIPTIWFYLIFT